MTIKDWQQKIHEWAKGKGWWPERIGSEAEIERIGTKLLLIDTEIAEATEDLRDVGVDVARGGVYGDERKVRELLQGVYTKPPLHRKPCGFPTELADACIRIFDLAEYLGIDLDAEIARKMAYNETRAHRHGGKAL